MRSLHVIDIENLIGAGIFTQLDAATCRLAYESQVDVGDDDLVVVACNPGSGLATGLAWDGARLRVRSGPDGADLALIEVLTTDGLEGRFERVVCASGDGRFAYPVARLAGQGIDVTVVARPESLAGSLRLAACEIVHFRYPDLPTPTAIHGYLKDAA